MQPGEFAGFFIARTENRGFSKCGFFVPDQQKISIFKNKKNLELQSENADF